MNIVKSTVEFRGYRIVKAHFDAVDVQIAEGTEVELKPTFTRTITRTGENSFSVILGVKIGSEDGSDRLPFFTELVIEGAFLLDNMEDAETIMKVNGVAILFPYLRSTLSVLTSISNINPIILPTINLAQMFEQEQKNKE